MKLSRLIVKIDLRHKRAPEASQFSLSSEVSLGALSGLADGISGLLNQREVGE